MKMMTQSSISDPKINDQTNPINFYGYTKQISEKGVNFNFRENQSPGMHISAYFANLYNT